ncbi:MAG: hypothetical protein PHS92_00665 [Candidatus Gracilibacteria bacterium]|nr:hypothetical protein [Candidatus Gracilibacteria bacterium]
MKNTKLIINIISSLGILFAYGNMYANYDYVCSYKVGKCEYSTSNCWWSGGEKYCQGTRKDFTTIGNTRVGCPTGSKSSSTTAFNTTSTSTLVNNSSFLFGAKAGIWNWNSVNSGGNSTDLSVATSINENFKDINGSNVIYNTDTVSCIVKVGGDSEAPTLNTSNITIQTTSVSRLQTTSITPSNLPLNTYDDFRGAWTDGVSTYTSIDNICKLDGKTAANLGEVEGVNYECLTDLPPKAEYRHNRNWGISNSGSQLGSGWCINTAVDWVSCKQSVDGFRITVSCDDRDSGCADGFYLNGVFKSGNSFNISAAGEYVVKVLDNTGNSTSKTINITENSNGDLRFSSQNSRSNVITTSNSGEKVKDKTGNWVSDFIQCYLSNKVSSCDNTDTLEPDGKVTFNGVDGIESGGIWEARACTKNDVSLNAVCTGDTAPTGIAVSGCKSGYVNNIQETQILSSNTTLPNDFGIIDNAGNLQLLHYKVDIIDRTEPEFISSVTSNGLAGNNGFSFAVKDEAPIGCSAINTINYSINVTLPDNSSRDITGVKNGATNLTVLEIYEDFNFTAAGTYKINSVTLTDKAGNTSVKNLTDTTFTVYPADISETNTIYSRITSANSAYGNNIDTYEYELELKDQYNNPVKEKSLYSVVQTGNTVLPVFDTSGDKAITEIVSGTSDNEGKIKFSIKSLAPGSFRENFTIKIRKWDASNNELTGFFEINKNPNTQNSFKKPITATLDIADGELSIGATEKVMLVGNNLGHVTASSRIIFKNLDKIISSDRTNYSMFTGSLSETENLISTINVKLNIKGRKTATSLRFSENPYVTYTVGSPAVRVSYFVRADDGDATDIDLSDTRIKFNGLQVAGGNTQGVGNQTVANDIANNFSDLSASSQRGMIKKNANDLIRGMISGMTVKGVKYVDGDVTLNSDDDISGVETLIVTNGNIKITGNINTSGKKFGIIVLKDGYDVNADYNGKGNIYIMPNVRYINALIYADGGLMSTDESGVLYTSDSAERTEILKKQLVVKGSVFTRNTIGGSLEVSGGEYILPGLSKTTSFDKAMIYDLNAIRIGNEGYNTSPNKDVNQGKKGNFIIIYNSSNQTDPPKGFTN